MNVLPFETDAHRAVQALLPWYANHSLDGEEAAQVEAHLAGCASCRAELAFDRRLQAAHPLPGDHPEVERGLARMREMIRERGVHPGSAPWLRWVLGGQFVVIAALMALLVLPRSVTEGYRALGAQSATVPPNAVVIFKPAATEKEIRTALRVSGARLVDGPTASDAYLLIVSGDDHVGAIARLRGQPAVASVESLDARPAP